MTTEPGAHPAGRVTARPAEILLVEDSQSDAAMTVHALRECGTQHRVHVVGDGQAALAFLHREGRYTDAP
jgi:CheY-like chemotaxis protein